MARTGAVLASVLFMMPVDSFAQDASTVAFEVASIRPPAPPTPQQVASRDYTSRGLNVFETRLAAGNVSLFDLIRTAFGVGPFQVSGPDWMRQTRFDIHATYPPGVGREQVPAMLRALLIERFGLVARIEQRTLPAYELVVGEGPLTMEKTASPDEPVEIRKPTSNEREPRYWPGNNSISAGSRRSRGTRLWQSVQSSR